MTNIRTLTSAQATERAQALEASIDAREALDHAHTALADECSVHARDLPRAVHLRLRTVRACESAVQSAGDALRAIEIKHDRAGAA